MDAVAARLKRNPDLHILHATSDLIALEFTKQGKHHQGRVTRRATIGPNAQETITIQLDGNLKPYFAYSGGLRNAMGEHVSVEDFSAHVAELFR
jgi:hypothetical protein